MDIKKLKPQKNSRYEQGAIHPSSCKKVFESQRGKPIIYRSSLEKKFILWCESNRKIKHWGSECIQIPYFNPIDNRTHIYNPDFVLEYIDGRKVIVEIKPYSQTQKPNINNEYAIRQYNTNILKWRAAKEFVKGKEAEFVIITERFFK